MDFLFTPEDLLQFMYQETSPEKTAAIVAALDSDWTLREKLQVLQASSNSLNRVIESPRTESVLNVLRYARETASVSAS